MDSCIFCKIIKKEIPAHIVYEDDSFLAFLDIHPHSVGNTILIPKEHCRWVWDMPNLGAAFELAGKIAKAIQKAFGQELVECIVYGEEVPHAHIKLFPEKTTAGDKNDFEGNKKKIIAAIS